MRSLILGCSSALLLLAAPASAAELVTTSDTDFEPASVVIVSPEDGSVFDGSPDVVVPVTIEYDGFGALAVSLWVDDAPAATCPEAPPCTIEATLSPGIHKLKAVGDDGVTQADTHEITVEVKDTGSATEGSATESDTETDTGSPTEATSSPTSGEAPATDTDGSDTDPTDGESDGSNNGNGDKEGCGCKAAPGAPDLLGLALLALFAPWRRRRHA
jgi:MYXO-CTERM domain-containing protein